MFTGQLANIHAERENTLSKQIKRARQPAKQKVSRSVLKESRAYKYVYTYFMFPERFRLEPARGTAKFRARELCKFVKLPIYLRNRRPPFSLVASIPSSVPPSPAPACFFSALSLVSEPANFLIFISVQLAAGINQEFFGTRATSFLGSSSPRTSFSLPPPSPDCSINSKGFVRAEPVASRNFRDEDATYTCLNFSDFGSQVMNIIILWLLNFVKSLSIQILIIFEYYFDELGYLRIIICLFWRKVVKYVCFMIF